MGCSARRTPAAAICPVQGSGTWAGQFLTKELYVDRTYCPHFRRCGPTGYGGRLLSAPLGSLLQVDHFLPSQIDEIPRQGYDLYLAVDDSFDYPFPETLRPFAFWAIDTHLNFSRSLKKARNCDYVFAAQKDGADRLRREGVSTATWLPLACDPEIHRRHDVAKRYDVGFVGNIFPGPREDLLRHIRRHFPNTFIGRTLFEEMSKIYSESRIVFNRSIQNDVNMRVFEALASGSLLVTNALDNDGLAELFQDGVHLATYANHEELIDKIEFYLRNDQARRRVESTGWQAVREGHTYRHRLESMLRTISEAKTVVRVTGVAPQASKDRHYFEFSRPELLARIPSDARRVLDVGCGAGALGQKLKERQHVEVVGLELDPGAAAVAQSRIDFVLVGDIESADLSSLGEPFDCVVCGDILEHLLDPLAFLQRVRELLSPQGILVTSIPNIRHHTVIRGLVAGNWTYESAGLLDQDHVQFFTRREMEKLLYRAGFNLEEVGINLGPGDEKYLEQAREGRLNISEWNIVGVPPSEAQDFLTYQYIVTAKPIPERDFGLTSIVILTNNLLHQTLHCLDVLRRLTDEPYELIVVDNGSTDGTVPFLRTQSDIHLIANPTNLGFSAGVNQGMAFARGKQILLLNNDVVVTTGWLRRLLEALHSDPSIGIVGPMTNYPVSGPQSTPIPYSEIDEIDDFAWTWSKRNAHQIVDEECLIGFCMLISRSVAESIGPFDEQFGIGNFEDVDYSLRALKAGFRNVIAKEVFIHHFGSQTFQNNGMDLSELFETNRQLFEFKWGKADANSPSQNGVTHHRPKGVPDTNSRHRPVKARATRILDTAEILGTSSTVFPR